MFDPPYPPAYNLDENDLVGSVRALYGTL
jgi:hypothetical protein